MTELKTQVSKVISYSQGIENPQVDDLLDQWYKAKKDIIDNWFNGKLIFETGEMQFTLSQEAKQSRLAAFLEWAYQINLDTKALVEFLEHIGVEDFYKNSLSNAYIISLTKIIPRGSKVVKSFKYFIEDKVLLKKLQDKASEIIQENKVKGTLCFSVHPLDFLSSSENQFHWRSCHALDGEYRSGNLSYMTDKSTIICYLKSDKDVQLPHFPEDVPWNNKKWRCLFFANNIENPEIVFAGRQYPFFSQDALDTVRSVFLDNFIECKYYYTAKWSNWTNQVIERVTLKDGTEQLVRNNKYFSIGHHIYEKNELIQDAPAAAHFNDLLYSSCYEPYYMYLDIYKGDKEQITTTIGNAVKCLRCGQEVITTRDTMMCLGCELEYGNSDSEEYYRCDCCDSRYLYEDGSWIGDDHICPNCAENESFICMNCGERYYNRDQRYNNSFGGFVCCYCDNKEED